MTFLTPLFLFGLLAAAIPLAIHLIRREQPPKVQFSTLRFLKNTKRKLVLFQQIQQWLLLLLRAALICLLVFAFARPLFHATPLANLVDGEPESVVILVDRSMSMQHSDRADRARQAARDVLSGLSAGDEAAVVSFAGAPDQVRQLSTDTAALRSFVDTLPAPGYDVSRFLPPLRLADEMLESARNERRRVVMISDFQASGMSQADSSFMLAPGVGFEGVDVGGGGVRNLTFTDVRSPDQLLEGVTDYEILARVRSTGTVHVDSADVTLYINGEPVATDTVTLDRTSEAVVNLPVSFEEGGRYAGELRLSGDDFGADNTHYFTVNVLPRIRVLVVNGAPSVNWFDDGAHWFTLALDTDGNSPFVAETVLASDLGTVAFADHDVVVLLNVAALSDNQAAQLDAYVRAGGNLWLAPGSRVDPDVFNRQLGDVSPARLSDSVDLGQNDYLLIADVDRRHPLIAPLDVDWSARFRGFWQTEPDGDTDVLMQFDNGQPALMERAVGEGRALMFASALDLSWSNLPLQGLYLPFVHESVNYLAKASDIVRSYRVGQSVDLAHELGAGMGMLDITGPAGDVVSLSADNAVYPATRPGFLQVGDPESGSLYAVNSDPRATDFSRVQVSDLHDRFINPETTPMASERVRTAQLIAELEQPQRLWWWVVLLVMLLLPLETLIANRTYR